MSGVSVNKVTSVKSGNMKSELSGPCLPSEVNGDGAAPSRPAGGHSCKAVELSVFGEH